MSTTEFRPRRSVLYMPSNERALEKAKSIPCDGLILDLEDAVADAKPAAREAACAAVRSAVRPARGHHPRQRRRHRVARRRPGCRVRRRPGRDRRAQGQQRRRGPRWSRRWPGTAPRSTPRCGRCSRRRTPSCTPRRSPAADDRLTVLVMGTNDLVKELYAEHVPGQAPMLSALRTSLLAARATGKVILDGVYNDVKDNDGFLAECRQGPRAGLRRQDPDPTGQVAGANEAFAPSEQAVEDARGILQAWEDGKGSGVVTYNGRMIENLHVESARRTLSINDAVIALEMRSKPALEKHSQRGLAAGHGGTSQRQQPIGGR